MRGDLNLDEVEIKVLFNGKKSDASFRNAYAVVILDAPKALKSEIDPVFSIDVDGDDVTFKDGKYQLPVLKKATLTATLDNASELNLGGVTYEWKVTSTNAAKATLSNAKSAQATFKAEEAGTYTVQVTVTNPKVTLDTYGQSTKSITIVVGKEETTTTVKNVRFDDSIADAMSAAGIKLSANGARINTTDNSIKWNFTLNGPEFVSNATTATTFSAKVIVDGVEEPELEDIAISSASDDSGSGRKIIFSDDGTMLSGPFDEDSTIEILITDVKYDKMDIKWTVDGEELTAADLAGKYSGIADSLTTDDAGEAIAFAYTTDDTGTDITFEAKKNFTKKTGDNPNTITTTGTDLTTTGLNGYATGLGYVEISVDGIKDMQQSYSIALDTTNNAALGAAIKINTIGIDSAADTETVTVTVQPAAANALKTGDPAYVVITNGATALTGGFALEAVVTVNGAEKVVDLVKDANGVSRLRLTCEDKDLLVEDIAVRVKTPALAAETPVFDGNKITIKFNVPVLAADVTPDKIDVATNSAMSGTGAVLDTSLSADGKTLTITAVGGTWASNKVIKHAEIKSAADPANKIAADAITINTPTLP